MTLLCLLTLPLRAAAINEAERLWIVGERAAARSETRSPSLRRSADRRPKSSGKFSERLPPQTLIRDAIDAVMGVSGRR